MGNAIVRKTVFRASWWNAKNGGQDESSHVEQPVKQVKSAVLVVRCADAEPVPKPQTPQTPQTTQTPQTPRTTQTPQTPRTTQTPQTPRTTQTPQPPPASDQTSNKNHLFVGCLKDSVNKGHLKKTFSRYGPIMKVIIKQGVDRNLNPTKYGFVVFENADSVDGALASRPIILCNGDRVNVNRSKKKQKS
ncbi:unnamed protein product [Aphis gossypii]|uniref:RRM domain-containing protein n=1 Tax=Aphis gossypii TaxID=80765 RepID=A0A9P0IKP0_APHGO|nr:unnamed protein product [Aphis gossypii]